MMIERERIQPKALVKLASGVTLGVVLGIYGLAGITSIEPGEAGLLVKMIGEGRGMQEETLDTGWHWIEPFKYDVVVYDTRSYQELIEDMPAQTADGQPILVDLSVELSLEDGNVPNLHEKIGRDYYDKVVYPALRSVIRNSTSTELSDQIYTGVGRGRIQELITDTMKSHVGKYGINVYVNLRDIQFTNRDFVATLERKASAAQLEEINRREAVAAEQAAIRVANVAEGEKQKRIKAAEAQAEELRLQGFGERQQKEEQAKGILAVGQAEAEVVRLRNEAMDGPGGDKIVALAWAENMGPNVKVYAVPTGAPGTASMMDLNGLLGGALKNIGVPK